jgi:hypothetical protein
MRRELNAKAQAVGATLKRLLETREVSSSLKAELEVQKVICVDSACNEKPKRIFRDNGR